MSEIELERGLCCYYENEKELSNIPSPGIFARGFELGYHLGKNETMTGVKRIISCNIDELNKLREE